MVLPIIYRKNAPYQVQYDWKDALTGNGYINFYGACSVTNGAVQVYFLTTTNSVDSSTTDTASTTGIFTKTNATGDLDLDFDITINIPIDLATGIAYVNLSTKVEGADTAQEQTTVTIYHVTAAGVETSLGSAIHTNNDPSTTQYYRNCFKIATTAKHFAVGEKMRVNVIVEDAHAGNADVWLYHDPSSSLSLVDDQDRTIGTDLIASIPFRVDN